MHAHKTHQKVLDKISFFTATERILELSFPSTSLYARENKHARYERFDDVVFYYVRFVRQLFFDEL